MTIYLSIIRRPLKNGKCNIVFDLVNGRDYRKKIVSGLTVYPKDWDNTNRRVKSKANNSKLLNNRIREFNDRIENALDFFHNGSFSISQVISMLQGKSDFKSIDDYVENEIKDSRKSPTYQDYKNSVRAIKIHMSYANDQKLLFEDINYRFLYKFKLNAEKNGIRGTSYNSYLKKIKAIMNDAYDKGYIFRKVDFKKSLIRSDTTRQRIKTCTPHDIEKAIGRINNIYDAQAVGLYLLMFSCRGMYPADIVSFRMANFDNINDFDVFCAQDEYYLYHRRSKTRDRNNEEMYIKIDSIVFELIKKIKYSFVYTHYRSKPNILAPISDEISIFDYDVDDNYSLHRNVWDIYAKRITKLLGYSFKTARKTFNTYALELKLSDSIRRILLGHSDPSELRSYDNINTNVMREQVEKAHTEVLAEFKAHNLIRQLRDKTRKLNVPECLYNDDMYLYNSIDDFYRECLQE